MTVAEGDSIQSGIDQTMTGETVCVDSGTYNESLTIDKGIELRASDSAAPPVLDSGETNAFAVKVTDASNVRIDGFEIRNFSEYGVYVNRSDNFTIRNTEVTDIDGVTTFADEAAVTLLRSDDAVVENNHFYDTDIQAVNATYSQRLRIHDNEIHDNYEGIRLTHSHDGVVTDNNATGNTGAINGGYGVRLSNADRTIIENNTVRTNSQRGIIISGSQSENLGSEDVVVRYNDITDNVFGIQMYRSSDGLLEDNRIVDNDIAVYVAHGSDDVTVETNRIAENVGGVNIENTTNVTVRANAIVNNTGTGTGDAADGTAGVRVADSVTPVIEDNEIIAPTDGSYTAPGERAITFDHQIEENYDSGPTIEPMVRNNTFSRYAIDVNLRYAIDAIVQDNEMSSGVLLQGSTNRDHDSRYFGHNFTNNLVGGEPIHHINGTAGETVQADAGQVLVTHSKDVTVDGGAFEDVVSGVQVAHSEDVTVRNVTIRNTSSEVFDDALYSDHRTAGLTIWQADNVTIENATVVDPTNYGIAVLLSNGSTVEESTVRGTRGAVPGSHDPSSVILSQSPSATVTNNTIIDGVWGLTVDEAPMGNLSVTHNGFRNHTGSDGGGVYIRADAEDATVAFNSFDNNHEGLEYDGTGHLNATNNWWGHHTGPSTLGFSDEEDPVTGEPADGDGDPVSENVRFDPWLEGPLDDAYFLVSIGETNSPVTAGEEFTANVTVENRGAMNDRQPIVLEAFDGTAVATEPVSLAPNESQSTTVTWQPNASHAGSGNVTVRTADTADERRVTIYSADTSGCDAVVAAGDSIQAAVDNAAAGATICVDVGTYRESVRINESLTLRALSTDRSPVLNGSAQETVGINVSDVSGVHLEGFTVESFYYEGVLVDNSSDVTISGVTLETMETFARDGALQITDSTNVTVTEAMIQSNDDAGIAVEASTNLTIADSRIADNGDEGIAVDDWGEMRIEDNEVVSNDDAGLQLFGFDVEPVNISVQRNLIADNDEGLLIEGSDGSVEPVTVTKNRIENNSEGVVLYSDATLDATENWWGAPSGPSGNVTDPNTGAVANGSGDSIDDNVAFDPWLEVIDPVARFAYAPTEPTVDDEVTFDASNATSPNGDLVEYRWDFTNDGTVDATTTDPITSHTFGTARTFDVTLTVVDTAGQMASISRTVSVADDEDASTPTPTPTETPTPTPSETPTETLTPTETPTDDPSPTQTESDTGDDDGDGPFLGADGSGFGGLVAVLAVLTAAILANRRGAS